MNECEKYQEMISAMLDGELGSVESEQLVEHMSSCARCRELYELLSAVTGSSAWELPEVPAQLHKHIMSGVKTAVSEKKKEELMRKIKPILITAACLVLIVGVIFGVPRFFRSGNNAPAALNTAVSANGNAAPADAAAPESAPAAADNNAGGSDGTEYTAHVGAKDPADKPQSDSSADDGSAEASNSQNGESPAAPVPEPEESPDVEEEVPVLNIEIASSVVTVEAGGKSTSEELNRDDTLIWLKAVIEGRAGRNIDAAKVEISRNEGEDYEVYISHDDSGKLIGSLTDDLSNSVELKRLSDFGAFEEMVDNVK